MIINNNLLYVASHLLRSRAHDVTSQTVTALLLPTWAILLHCARVYFLHRILCTFLSICILNLISYPFRQYPLLLAKASESIGVVFFLCFLGFAL